MSTRTIFAVAVAATTYMLPQAAPAFDRGCYGAAECYEEVRPRRVSRTVERELMVEPPSMYYEYAPPHYRWVGRRVLLKPAHTADEVVPAVTRRVYETVVVRPATTRWVHRRGLFGRNRMCKVRFPAVTRRVVRHVVVRPARRIRRRIPAVYGTIPRRELVRSARARKVYVPATYRTVRHRVPVPAGRRYWVRSRY